MSVPNPRAAASRSVALFCATFLAACGAREALPIVDLVDAGREDAAIPGIVDADLVDGVVVDADTPGDRLHRSVSAAVDASITEFADGRREVGMNYRSISTFQTLPSNLTIRRAAWEYDVRDLAPPEGYELSGARLLVTSDYIALADLLTYASDLVMTESDFDRSASLMGRIEGTSGPDGTTWSFDLTSQVADALSNDHSLGVRAQLTVETLNGWGSNDGMSFASFTIELEFDRAP